jgi:hypothetical protein
MMHPFTRCLVLLAFLALGLSDAAGASNPTNPVGVAPIAVVKADTTSSIGAYSLVEFCGYYICGDNGGDVYARQDVPCNNGVDNGGSCIKVPYGANGRWYALQKPFGNSGKLSVLNFGAKADWVTGVEPYLTNAETYLSSLGGGIISMPCSPGIGCGYNFSSTVAHIVPSGITLDCPGGAYMPPPLNDFRHYSYALIIKASGGLKLNNNAYISGNCNVLQTALATAVPPGPTDQQAAHARVAAFTGIGVQNIGDSGGMTGGSIIGFDRCTVMVHSRAFPFEHTQMDCNSGMNIVQANEGLTNPVTDVQIRPLATATVGQTVGTVPSVLRIPLSGVADHSGHPRWTYSSPCNTTACPQEGWTTAWIVAPVNAQSTQGRCTVGNSDTTGFDCVNESSAYLTGTATLTCTTIAGTYRLTCPFPLSRQIMFSQNVTCFSGTAQIDAAPWISYGIIMVDTKATTTGSCNITISDDSNATSGITKVSVSGSDCGTNYNVGNVVTYQGGTFVSGPGSATVTEIDNNTGSGIGCVTKIEPKDVGDYTALPPSPNTPTGGDGTGLKLLVSSQTQLVLDPNNRDGCGITTGNTNAVHFHAVHILSHTCGVQFGLNTTRITGDIKVDDEFSLQDSDPSRIGIHYVANAKTVFLDVSGSFYNRQIVDDTCAAFPSGANSVTATNLGIGQSGAFNRIYLEVNSCAPGTPKKKQFIFNNNSSASPGTIYISDDADFVTFNSNTMKFAGVYGQSDATQNLVKGSANEFAVALGAMALLSDAPGSGGLRVTTSSTTPIQMTNPDCVGTVYSSVNTPGTMTIIAPPNPVLGCETTLRPNTNSMIFDPNGNGIRTSNTAIQTSPLFLQGTAGAQSVRVKWNGFTWDYSGGTPDLLAKSGLGNGLAPNGQVYMSCKGTPSCSAGNGQLQLCRMGPGWLTINNVSVQIPPTCVLLDNSVFSSTTSAIRNIYANWTTQNATITNDGTGHVQLTPVATTGYNAGTPISCVNALQTPLANVIWDPNTTFDGTHIVLIDVSYVADESVSCTWVGLISSPNIHVTDPKSGVEVRNTVPQNSLVGACFIDASHNLNQAGQIWDCGSWYNRQQNKCIGVYSTDRTTSSTSYVEPNSEISCEFWVWGPPSVPGTPAPGVSFSASGMMANDTVSDGEEVSVGFDGTTPEIEQNKSGNGGTIQMPFGMSGVKFGLSEGKHKITLLAKSITGGTTTIYSEPTSLEVGPMQ